MNRRDYYFLQLLSESELDDGFEQAEVADRAIITDLALTGVTTGLSVAQHSPTADLTVDVAAGNGYNSNGERLSVATLQVLDVSVDHLSASTDVVGGAGFEKIVSVFLEFVRALSDPRIDGNSNTVFFVRNESFAFHVVQGAETSSLPATPPALEADKVLLADIRRSNAQTQIFNTDITPPGGSYTAITNRRQAAFVLSAGALEVLEGTPEESDQAILTEINNHITGVANIHPATAVDYAGGGNWADGTTNPADDVEAQLDKIVVDLSATTGSSGTDKIGGEAITSALTSGLDLTAGTLTAQLQDLVDNYQPLDGTETWSGAQIFTGLPDFQHASGIKTNDITVSSGTEVAINSQLSLDSADPIIEFYPLSVDGNLRILNKDSTDVTTDAGIELRMTKDADANGDLVISRAKRTGTNASGVEGFNLKLIGCQGRDAASGDGNEGGAIIIHTGQKGTGGASVTSTDEKAQHGRIETIFGGQSTASLMRKFEWMFKSVASTAGSVNLDISLHDHGFPVLSADLIMHIRMVLFGVSAAGADWGSIEYKATVRNDQSLGFAARIARMGTVTTVHSQHATFTAFAGDIQPAAAGELSVRLTHDFTAAGYIGAYVEVICFEEGSSGI